MALVPALALIAAVVGPALADGHHRSDRLVCVNNLRQIYVAMQEWGTDHNDQVPFAVPVSEGGTRLHPLAENVWLHFSWISNELRTARVLACPSDNGMVARDFSASPDWGYINPNFRNNATSYFLSHGRDRIVWPTTFIAGDRNVAGGKPQGDSVFGGQAFSIFEQAHWTNGLHYPMGDVVRGDGQVLQLSDERFRQVTGDGRQGFSGALWQYILPR